MSLKYTPGRGDNLEYVVRLDVSEIEFPHKDQAVPWLEFPVGSYGHLSHDPPDSVKVDIIFAPANRLMSMMSRDKQVSLIMSLALMNSYVLDFLNEHRDLVKIRAMAAELGKRLLELDEEIGLHDMIREYTFDEIPIGDYADAGTKPQDDPVITWKKEDVRVLLQISILCKIIAPIFGLVMDTVQRLTGVSAAVKKTRGKAKDNKFKEIVAGIILTEYLRKHHEGHVIKLNAFIEHTTRSKIRPDNVLPFHGINAVSLENAIYASIFVKSLVNINLFQESGNVMSRIHTAIRKIATNQQDTASKTANVLCRKPILGDDGEQNIAQLEVHSVPSHGTCDTPASIRAAVAPAIKRAIYDFDVDEELFEDARDYYRRHPFTPNDYNQFLVCTFWGKYLGGAKSVMHLGSSHFMDLTALLQIIMVDADCIAQGVLLTAILTRSVKTELTPEEQRIRIGYKSSSSSYLNCASRQLKLPGQDVTTWDTVIDELMNWLVTSVFKFNIATPVARHLAKKNNNGDENKTDEEEDDSIETLNGSVVSLPETFANEFFRFLEECGER